MTDICGPLKLGRRGMVCVGAVEQYSTLSLIYWFHSTSTTIFHFYCVAVEFLLPWTSVAIFIILVHSSIKYYVCFIIFAACVTLAHSFILCNSRKLFFAVLDYYKYTFFFIQITKNDLFYFFPVMQFLLAYWITNTGYIFSRCCMCLCWNCYCQPVM